MATKVGGWASYLQYSKESTYASSGSPTTTTFGQGTTVSLTRRNNMEKVYGLGDRNLTGIVAKNFEGTASIDFNLSNGWFLRGVLGSLISSGSAAVFTHIYKERPAQHSFTLENGVNLDTDHCATITGAVFNTCTITAAVNEIAKVRLECPYSSETESSTLAAIPVTEQWPSEPLSFAGGTFKVGGTTYADIQNVELTINNNVELVYGLGDRRAKAAVGKNRDYSIRATMAFQDASKFLEKVYGNAAGVISGATPDPSANATLIFTNNGAGSALKTITFNMGSIWFDESTLPQNPDELVKEEVSMHAMYCGSAVFQIGGTAGSPAKG